MRISQQIASRLRPPFSPARVGALALVGLLAALPLLLVGCTLPGCPSEPEGSEIRVSQQAAQRLQARVEQIAAAARPDFALEMTDEEATSYLTLNLAQSSITDGDVR